MNRLEKRETFILIYDFLVYFPALSLKLFQQFFVNHFDHFYSMKTHSLFCLHYFIYLIIIFKTPGFSDLFDSFLHFLLLPLCILLLFEFYNSATPLLAI